MLIAPIGISSIPCINTVTITTITTINSRLLVAGSAV
jgi:hypothetical protein